MTLSWLSLERYALGELPPDQAAAVEAALAEDAEARARLAEIRGDDRPLPPLDLDRPDSGLPLPPLPGASEEPAEEPGGAEVIALWPRVLAGGALLAAAAAVLVVLRPVETPRETPPQVAWKGGEVAVEVEGEGGAVVPDGGRVAAGERIQVRLTCPPGERDVVLTADGEVAWEGSLTCRNRVRLPGAWTVDGPTELCVAVHGDGEAEVCTRLR